MDLRDWIFFLLCERKKLVFLLHWVLVFYLHLQNIDTHRTFYRPASFAICALKSRDVLPNGRQTLQIILTYNVEVDNKSDGNDYSFRFPQLNDVLYDSVFEGVLLMVFDAKKKRLSCQDVYTKSLKLTKKAI